ncbi:MFS transporter [Dyella sp. M7H15-1]|uniref:MFS transporter n=1 Tax=Dyella sp. M7H15-1 TaxID=2501295 RepID=UPI001005197F|nr:MFS transporter [Dyella sp. M7H15-1]QAU23376.1 MFS transporter [Dyella sp. M7H15-1]
MTKALARNAVAATAAHFGGRAGHFMIMAFLLATQNTYASTLAASLFLSRFGVSAIPIYYVLFAAISIPCSIMLSGIIDRFPRRVILKFMLGVFVLVSLTMSAVLRLGDSWYYVVYLGISVCEQLLYSIYYVLFADYFSVTDAKRAIGRVAVGMALGGLIGGAGVGSVNAFAGPRIALLLTPALVLVVIAYFAWLSRRHQPLEDVEPTAEESLRLMPRLLRRYPLVSLLAAAMFLNVFLQCVSEYLAFSIYTLHFPSIDRLATFLGFIQGGLNLLGFVIIVAFTDRQMTRLGVVVMNRVYPALNTLSFGVLSVSTSLPAGVLANIAYDPFVYGIDVPVGIMNYNAIRYRLVGRVRVFIDGFVYPLGLAFAGVSLEAFQRGLSLRTIAQIGFVESLLLFVIHWYIGIHYVRGLLDMLRDGVVDFENVDRAIRLPPETIAEIRTMLRSDSRTAYAALQMALWCNHEFGTDEIAPALAAIPIGQGRAIMERLTVSVTPARHKTFEELARSPIPAVRQLALEVLARCTRLHPGDLDALMDDPDEGIRSVAAATLLCAEPSNATALAVLGRPLKPESALGAIGVLRFCDSESAGEILSLFGAHGDGQVRATALNAVGSFKAHTANTLNWARRAASDDSPGVRESALRVLAQMVPTDELNEVLDVAWTDPSSRVRQAVVETLSIRGKDALPSLNAQLWNGREEAQLAAIEALGRIQGADAEQNLLEMLETTKFPLIALYRRFAQHCDAKRPGWQSMSFVIDDSTRRVLRLVLQALEALGHHRTLNLARTALRASDERTRANAIESLATLPHRQFVVPLAPLLEERVAGSGKLDRDQTLLILRDAQAIDDERLRAAAVIAWHAETGDIPPSAWADSSQLVADAVRSLIQGGTEDRPYRQEATMSRIAFLHSVPLFSDTTFDDLIVLDRTLTCETYLQGENIVTEGEAGDRMYIVYRGEVVVRKQTPDGNRELARLGIGEFFGEMSLFDNEPRLATVSALDDVEMLVITRDRFHNLIEQRPAVLMQLCAALVRRLRKTVT